MLKYHLYNIFFIRILCICLDENSLLALGYIPEKITKSNEIKSVCTDPSLSELCVNQSMLKQKIDNDTANLRWFMQQVYSLDEIFNRYVSYVYSANLTTTNSTYLIRGVNRIFHSSINSFSACYQQLSLLQHGINCALASSSASELLIITPSSASLKFNIAKFGNDIVGACWNVFDAVCTAGTGYSLTLNISNSLDDVHTDFAGKYQETCKQVYRERECESCTLRNEIFITRFIKPFVYDMFLSQTDQNTIKAYYENAVNNTPESFNPRELSINPTVVQILGGDVDVNYTHIAFVSSSNITAGDVYSKFQHLTLSILIFILHFKL